MLVSVPPLTCDMRAWSDSEQAQYSLSKCEQDK
jgi:hypothetical protein